MWKQETASSERGTICHHRSNRTFTFVPHSISLGSKAESTESRVCARGGWVCNLEMSQVLRKRRVSVISLIKPSGYETMAAQGFRYQCDTWVKSSRKNPFAFHNYELLL